MQSDRVFPFLPFVLIQEILMVRRLRKKLAVIGLLLYWPVFFTLAHIPLPRVFQQVHQVNSADKVFHFLAYFVLTFLAWGVINPYERVNWRRITVWLVLAVVACHGVLDEWLQGFVQGRVSDVWDFAADMTGAMASLILLTLFPLWPAMLVLAGAAILLLTNCSAVNVTRLMPITGLSFFFSGF